MSFDAKALEKIIEGCGVPYKQNTISFIFSCPRCSKAQKLYIRKRDGQFVCWKCRETDGFKGKAEWALRELIPGVSIADLREKLYGTDIPDQLLEELTLDFEGFGVENEDEIFMEAPPEELLWPPQFVSFDDGESFVNGARYLHSRGITIEHIRTYDIRYDPPDQRVILPVKVNDSLIGWQARLVGPSEYFDEKTGRTRRIPKILTSDSLRGTGGKYLMFQDRLRGSEHCVLTEGPFDSLKAHRCGGNVASMGKSVTAAQLQTILSYGVRKIYLALDPDAADEVTRIINVLEPGVETYLLLPPRGYEDLGGAPQDAVYEEFKRAPHISRGTLMVSLGSQFVY